MDVLKRLALIVCLPAFLVAADLTDVKAVYLLPMSRGMDQYLANRLTNQHVFQVVTDPKLADAFFTDRLGESFLSQVENMTATERSEPQPAKDGPRDPKDEKDAKESEPKNTLLSETVNKLGNPAANSAFGRGKGTIFLIDARSRQVVWSTFELPSGSAAKEMDRASSEIVARLMKDLGLKKK